MCVCVCVCVYTLIPLLTYASKAIEMLSRANVPSISGMGAESITNQVRFNTFQWLPLPV